MAVILDATVGGVSANSYETEAEALAYYETRLPIAEWEAGDQPLLLMMGTRQLDALFRALRVYVPACTGCGAYYRVRRQWTGAPATTTQRLAWPRTGMYDGNGNLIPSNVIPQDLKDALSEFAGQLAKGDRTLDNDALVQGIASVSAGSVSVSFKDGVLPQVLPDAVMNIMPPSWFTDELYIPALGAEFELL